VGQISRPRHAWLEALGLDILRCANFEIFLLPRARLRQIGDIAAFDDAEPRWHCHQRTEFIGHPLRRRVGFEIPIRRVDRLPDAVQIGCTVGTPRNRGRILRGNSRCAAEGDCGDDRM
jgi:hypothetical protein